MAVKHLNILATYRSPEGHYFSLSSVVDGVCHLQEIYSGHMHVELRRIPVKEFCATWTPFVDGRYSPAAVVSKTINTSTNIKVRRFRSSNDENAIRWRLGQRPKF